MLALGKYLLFWLHGSVNLEAGDIARILLFAASVAWAISPRSVSWKRTYYRALHS